MKIIFLNMTGRSGSFFLHSLLDMHPNIASFVYPFQIMQFLLDLSRNREDIVDEFIELNTIFFENDKSPLASIGDYEPRKIDKGVFRDNFLNLCGEKIENHKSFFELIHLALAETLGQNSSQIEYILVHFHQTFFDENLSLYPTVDFLFNQYKDVYFLITTREVYEDMNSLLHLFTRNLAGVDLNAHYKMVAIFDYTARVVLDLEFLHKNSHKYKMLFVDLARLHKLQKNGMQKIADFLQLSYQESLCCSTIYGVLWSGNSVTKAIYKGYKCFNTNRQKAENITSYVHTCLIGMLLGESGKIMGYDVKKNNLLQRVYAIVYTIFLVILPIFYPFSKSEAYEFKNLKKNDIQNNTYKKFPLFVAKIFIFIKKNLNRKRELLNRYYGFCSVKKLMQIVKAKRYLAHAKFEKENFL